MNALRRLACSCGFHGHFGGCGAPYSDYPPLEWCLRCGRTWEVLYDFMAFSQHRRRDLKFGEPI